MRVPLGIADFLYRARAVHSDRLAVVDEPGVTGSLGRLDYGELLQRCDGMVKALDSMGVDVGDRVAIISPNAAKMLIALYAVAGSGRVLVPVNFRLTAAEAQFIVDDSGAGLVLIDPELEERFASIKAPRRVVMDGEQDAELFAADAGGDGEWGQVDEGATATINYTSGTTAEPKGVVLSHRAHWLNAVVVGWGFGLSESDRYLHTLPIFHVNGWGLPLACAALGVPNVIQRKVRGEEILDRVDREGITFLCGATPVATTIQGAAQGLREAGKAVPGEGVTRMVSGGAPTPSVVIEAFERSTGWEMIQAYGLTETAPVLTVNRVPDVGLAPAARAERLAAAGAPLLGVRLKVDEEGQILARTAKAMSAYLGKEDLYEAATDGGWFRTGDGGSFDGGVLHVTDRKKDVIVTGGENVSSVEVESVLLEHPDVADVAVIGVPHERWGETPKALVVLRGGVILDEAALIEHCRTRLAGFKCPTSVEQRESLPRTATGKLQKYLIRQPYWTR
jgi:fatty-acyl-CoA synthase